MARRPAVVSTNGHSQIHWPGAYRHVLEKKCARDAFAAAPDFLMIANDAAPAWERAKAEHEAALMAERWGQPVTCQSYMLPHGMPSPMFDRWPRDGSSRSFSITPDDVVTYKPRKVVTQWV